MAGLLLCEALIETQVPWLLLPVNAESALSTLTRELAAAFAESTLSCARYVGLSLRLCALDMND